jgi:uncharacterized protein YhaN
MRLKRIEVDAFGALRDCSLDGLADGLTVVLGPNESGKSTYAALVRQVLYGFPDKRSKDFGYQPGAGGRAGRLVFGDESGEWGIHRTEGSKGGPVRVDAIRGAERPGLLGEVVGSVTEQTFRIVFGFGLDELADIESGTDKDVVARLYAGVSGLEVNPMDVRRELDESAGKLFKTRGISEVGTLLDSAGTARREIQALEAEARDYASDQARLKEMSERLAPLKQRRDEADRKLRALERDAQQAANLVQSIAEKRDEAADYLTAAESNRHEAERTVVDEHLLAISSDLAALLEDASAAKGRVERAGQLDSRAAEMRRKAEALAVPEGAQDTAEARARLDAWRDKRAKLEVESETAHKAAAAAAANAESLAAATQGGGERRSTANVILAVALLLLGVGGIAAGLLTRQFVTAGMGGVLIVAGAIVLLAGRARGAGSLSADAVRARAEAESSAALARGAADRLEAEAAGWASWLAESSLDGRGVEAAAVGSLLDGARKRDEYLDQAESIQAEAAREREVAADWAHRLVALVRGPLGIAETSPEPQALAIRARSAMDVAVAAREKKRAAIEVAAAAEAGAATAAKKADELEAALGALGQAHNIEGDIAAGAQAAVDLIAADLRDVNEEYDLLVAEHAALEGRLGTQGRDATMARGRQRLEGLLGEASATADRYLVEALAVRLIDRARERFERERQPEVVRVAQDVFASITDGRYAGVRVPFGTEAITVVSASGEVRTTAQLSRGAAEQLYLALRVGLIESFGAQGPHLPVLMDDIVVNYDVERVQGAAAAVSALAQRRQVVFFTCHPATAEALTSRVPGAGVIELARCP